MKSCLGCGIKLQNDDSNNLGYVDNLDKDYCMRCYKLINYGIYEKVLNNTIDYQKLFKEIKDNKSLVIFLIDILNIPNDLINIKTYFKNYLLVLNKKDLLPLSVKDSKIIKYFNNLDLNYLDIEIISTNKNYHLDNLMKKIEKYQNNKDIYVIGYTNAGKSSLINKIIKNYSNKDYLLTISPLPTTTLDCVKIKINEKLNIIDTPGLVDKNNIINYVDNKMYKKLNSKKEIKPKTFRINKGESLIIDNILRINYLSYNNNSFTFYIPNEIKVERISKNNDNLINLDKRMININENNDLVINGLGFIKMVNKCRIELYLDKKISVFERNNLI